MPKSRVSLIVVSVRSARPSLKYCLTFEARKWICGLDAAVEDLGVKPARGSAVDTAPEDDRGLVGPSERELIRERLLEPRAARDRPVEHAGIGDLQLAERERVVVAALAILRGERGGQHGPPTIEEQADILRGQTVADPGERVRVLAR